MIKMKILSIAVFLLISVIQVDAQTYIGESSEIKSILANIEGFSKAVVAGDHQSIGYAYTQDGKIFPGNKKIIAGKEAVTRYWQNAVGGIIYHKILPEEIKIIGNEAYDYGYYEGITRRDSGEEISWKGKYVIVWKKVDGDWKIYLDIWNRVAE